MDKALENLLATCTSACFLPSQSLESSHKYIAWFDFFSVGFLRLRNLPKLLLWDQCKNTQRCSVHADEGTRRPLQQCISLVPFQTTMEACATDKMGHQVLDTVIMFKERSIHSWFWSFCRICWLFFNVVFPDLSIKAGICDPSVNRGCHTHHQHKTRRNRFTHLFTHIDIRQSYIRQNVIWCCKSFVQYRKRLFLFSNTIARESPRKSSFVIIKSHSLIYTCNLHGQ